MLFPQTNTLVHGDRQEQTGCITQLGYADVERMCVVVNLRVEMFTPSRVDIVVR